MAPPCHSFPVKELPLAIQANLNGKLRKTEDGRRIDLLRDCELLKLLQYECVVTNPEVHSSPIQCWPVQRLFRRWVPDPRSGSPLFWLSLRSLWTEVLTLGLQVSRQKRQVYGRDHSLGGGPRAGRRPNNVPGTRSNTSAKRLWQSQSQDRQNKVAII